MIFHPFVWINLINPVPPGRTVDVVDAVSIKRKCYASLNSPLVR